MADESGHVRRGIKFDPTVNLGHIGSAVVFLVTATAGFVLLDAKSTRNADEIRRVEASTKETIIRAELDLSRRITEQQSTMNKGEMNTAEGLREIKLLMRDGFKEIKDSLDRKVDKPGR